MTSSPRQVDAERRLVDLDRRRQRTSRWSGRGRPPSSWSAHERALDEVVRLVERRVGEGVAPEGDLRKLEAERGRTRIARVRLELEGNTSTR